MYFPKHYISLSSFFLIKVFQNKGISFSEPVIASCKSSVAASSLAFCAYLLGYNIPVYKARR